MIELDRQDEVFILTMNAEENRWNTTFVRAMSEALDEVEASTGPAALVTRSANEKFYSNGLDLAWVMAPEEHPEAGDRAPFGDEFMALMGRLITFPMPTIAAINGHAFGAGFMNALCHDVRIMRADRGFICANEMQLGMQIPEPELALFRHKLPMNVFYETVQLARRWTGPSALDAGIVAQISDIETLQDSALAKAKELAPLATKREIYGGQKEKLFGQGAVINRLDGAAHLLKNAHEFHH